MWPPSICSFLIPLGVNMFAGAPAPAGDYEVAGNQTTDVSITDGKETRMLREALWPSRTPYKPPWGHFLTATVNLHSLRHMVLASFVTQGRHSCCSKGLGRCLRKFRQFFFWDLCRKSRSLLFSSITAQESHNPNNEPPTAFPSNTTVSCSCYLYWSKLVPRS